MRNECWQGSTPNAKSKAVKTRKSLGGMVRPGGEDSGAVPHQITACAPKKWTGSVLLECNSRPETLIILDVTPAFVSKNGFFVDFAINTVCFGGFTPELMKFTYVWGRRPLFFCLHLRIRGNSQVFPEDFLVFTSEFVEIRTSFEMKNRIYGNSRIFWHENLFFLLGLHLRTRGNSREIPSSCGPRSRIQLNKLFVPPQNLFMPPPPPPSHAILAPGLGMITKNVHQA